jgi:hypothetical protein
MGNAQFLLATCITVYVRQWHCVHGVDLETAMPRVPRPGLENPRYVTVSMTALTRALTTLAMQVSLPAYHGK